MFDPEELEETTEVERGARADWRRHAPRRLVTLAVGRAGAQGLAIVWFLVAARQLSETEFGLLATGVAFFGLFMGLGDLGTTRTVVRYVAADERTLWSAYARAAVVRVAGGVAVGVAAAAVLGVALDAVPTNILLLAGLMGTLNGVTEVGFGALRSVGRVGVESSVLVFERALFLALGTAAIVFASADAADVLALYALANGLSALFVTAWVWHCRPADARHAGPMLDREGLLAATSFTLVTVSPRVTPVVLAVLANAVAVGVFTVAQRPVEALTVFTLYTASSVLPLLRGMVVDGRVDEAGRATVRVADAIMVLLVPVTAWFLVSPGQALTLLYGEGRFQGAEVLLRILALTALTWTLRGACEYYFLAVERARAIVTVTATGTVAALVLAIVLVPLWNEEGAAIAVLAAEVLMTVLLFVRLPVLRSRHSLALLAMPVAGVGLSALPLLVARDSTGASLVVVVLLSVGAAIIGLRLLQRVTTESGEAQGSSSGEMPEVGQ